MIVARVTCSDRTGTHEYSARLLHEFGQMLPGFDEAKIADLYLASSRHRVLFTDYTKGSVRDFVSIILNPASVWLEFVRETDSKPVGIGYVTGVIPNFDAQGHFAFWDSVASGREPLVLAVMKWVFDRYNLHRMTAQIPPYQSGVIRFTKRLGFKEEGELREAVLYEDDWMPLRIFGILRDELDAALRRLEDGND